MVNLQISHAMQQGIKGDTKELMADDNVRISFVDGTYTRVSWVPTRNYWLTYQAASQEASVHSEQATIDHVCYALLGPQNQVGSDPMGE